MQKVNSLMKQLREMRTSAGNAQIRTKNWDQLPGLESC